MAPKAPQSRKPSKSSTTIPANAVRHIERSRAAARTLGAPVAVVPPAPVMETNGRVSFPTVVEYRLADGRTVPTPPVENDIVYRVVIHDLAVYDWMRSRGLMEQGHRVV